MSQSGITRDDWLKALNEAGVVTEDDQNAVTVNEFMVMFDLPRQQASRQLIQLEAAGRAVRTRKIGTTPDGKTVRYLAFRLRQDA